MEVDIVFIVRLFSGKFSVLSKVFLSNLTSDIKNFELFPVSAVGYKSGQKVQIDTLIRRVIKSTEDESSSGNSIGLNCAGCVDL